MKTQDSFRPGFILLLLAIIAGASLMTTADSSPAPPEDILFERAIIYGTAGDVELRLNLARPASVSQSAPAVVVIHGGGWAGGDRSLHDDLTWKFAQRGYVSATISYRLAPRHPFPAAVEDAKCAVRFLREHAEEYGLDPDRIGAVGLSAGAHLAMMLGAMNPEDGLDGEGGWLDQSSKVQAVVSFVGPTDLTADDFGEATRGILQNFLGGTRDEKLEDYRKASPVTYVSSGDSPMLLFHGTKDPLIPNSQAYRMAEALTAAGVPGRVELLIGAGHGWTGAELERTMDQMFQFFDSILR